MEQLIESTLQSLQIGVGELLLGAVTIAVSVAVTIVAVRVATRAIQAALGSSSVGEVSIIINIVRAVVVIVAVYFVGENVFHVELSGIMQALGVTTLVVSLGLQDLIKNVVAGIQIVMTHLLSVGDHIDMGGLRGEVLDINWRQTTLRDKDGNPNVIPNSELMGGTFKRLDGKMAHRYVLECDIKPGLDLDRVASDIEQLADEVLVAGGWKAEEATEVRFVGSTANGVAASIRLFLTDVEYTTRAQDAVMRAIGQRGYLADWTNDAPEQGRWR